MMSVPMHDDAVHDLTMLYLQQHPYLGLNPQELLDKYLEIRDDIVDRILQIDKAQYREL